MPLSDDFSSPYEYTYGEEKYLAWSYYYQFGFPHHLIVVSNCMTTESGFKCLNTCESVWFKVWNATAADFFGEHCDKAFVVVVMQTSCRFDSLVKCSEHGTTDPFFNIKRSVGRKRNKEIQMSMVSQTVLYEDGKSLFPSRVTNDAESTFGNIIFSTCDRLVVV